MNKQNLKNQRAITLIALIITIVVLLILAVVAIGAVQESGIIVHAQNAASGYNQSKADEESAISGYEALIEENLPENGNGGNNPTEEILWAFLDFGDEGKELYFIGNVSELDLSQDKEVKAYVATFNDDTEEIEYDENGEVTTVRLSDTLVYLEKENTSMQRLILGAEIYECLGNNFNHLNSKTVIFESGITALDKLFDNGNSFLETIEIPATVARINQCFYRCTNLTNITIKKTEGSLDLSNSGLTQEQIDNIIWAPEVE